MPNENQSERDLFRAALQRTEDCPPVAELEHAIGGDAKLESKIITHLQSCAYCQSELEMLKAFHRAEVPQEDAAAVALITRTLRDHPLKVPVAVPARAKESKTRSGLSAWLFAGSWMRPAALAVAGALVVIAIGLQVRRASPPVIDGASATGTQVFRSQAMTILSPTGDLKDAPSEIRWEPVPTAATYQVRLMEVDQHEMWNAHTAQTSASLPDDIRTQIVPLKTVLLEVTAFDAKGRKVAQSEVVRIRVLQNIYSH